MPLESLSFLTLDLNSKKNYFFIEKLLVNVGCYIIKILNLIPKNTKYNINDLLNHKKLKNKKIEAFPIGEDSCDRKFQRKLKFTANINFQLMKKKSF